MHLLRLLPICQTPRLTNCFLILKSCRLAAICYKFYDVMSDLVLTKHTSTHLVNEPRLLSFLVAAFLSAIPRFILESFLWSFSCLLCVAGASSQVKVDPFIALCRFVPAIINQFLVNRIVYIVRQGGSTTAAAGPSKELFIEQMVLGQVVHVVLFSFDRLHISGKFGNFTHFMYFAVVQRCSYHKGLCACCFYQTLKIFLANQIGYWRLEIQYLLNQSPLIFRRFFCFLYTHT